MRIQRVARDIGNWMQQAIYGPSSVFGSPLRPPKPWRSPVPTQRPRSFSSAAQAHPVFSQARLGRAGTLPFPSARAAGLTGSWQADGSRIYKFRDGPDLMRIKVPMPRRPWNGFVRKSPLHDAAAEKYSDDLAETAFLLFPQLLRQLQAELARSHAHSSHPAWQEPGRPTTSGGWAGTAKPMPLPRSERRPPPRAGSAPDPVEATSRTSVASMPIKTERDTTGWAAYVQQLRSRHGWTTTQLRQWIDDYQAYVKFGNADAAAAFNRKYGALMGAEIENSDLRAHYTQLMKAMMRAVRAS